jgi:hypothetical protein
MTSEPSTKQSEEIQRLMIEAARTQLAAISAVTKFWAGWAESADKYTQSISDELARISEGDIASKDIIARVADLTREYMRELTDLPTMAVRQFSSEIEKISKPQPKRARNVKVKE